MNASEMIIAAGLDWNVAMRAIPNVGRQSDKQARRYHLVRLPRNAQEAEVPLGVVSARYLPLQNNEAFEFFDPIIGESKAVFETAGSLGNGERIWVLAKVPGEIRVTKNDLCSKYLLLSNTHDGRGSVSVKFTPIRVVCENTLILAMQSGEKAHNVRHTRYLPRRIKHVQELMGLIWRTFQNAEELFQSLVRIQVDRRRFDCYIEAVYPRSEEQRRANRRPPGWDRVFELFDAGDAPALTPSHTLWGAYNSVTRYEDYRRANESGADRRLNRVWFGHSAEVKLHALQQAQVLGELWRN